jgi:hypothetical protein
MPGLNQLGMPCQGVNRSSPTRGIVPKSPQSSFLPPRPTLDPAHHALLRARAIRDARTDLEAIVAKVEQMRVTADVRAPRKRGLG